MEQARETTRNRNASARNNMSKNETVKKTPGPGRPPKATKKKRVGRPKGSTNKKKGAQNVAKKGRDLNKALRARIADANQKLKAAKAELKQKLRSERENVKAAQAELKEALKRERALIKLFTEKDRKLQSYGARWVKKEIEKIQAPPKKRRRRTKAA